MRGELFSDAVVKTGACRLSTVLSRSGSDAVFILGRGSEAGPSVQRDQMRGPLVLSNDISKILNEFLLLTAQKDALFNINTPEDFSWLRENYPGYEPPVQGER